MPSRLILILASAAFAFCGLATLFAPEELAALASTPSSPVVTPALQMVGGGLLGFALLNWFSRSSRVGGIYGRPVGLGNLMFSGVLATTIGRAAIQGSLPISAMIFAILFGAIALAFAWLVFLSSAASS